MIFSNIFGIFWDDDPTFMYFSRGLKCLKPSLQIIGLGLENRDHGTWCLSSLGIYRGFSVKFPLNQIQSDHYPLVMTVT